MQLNHTLKFYKYRINKKADLLNRPRPLQEFFLPMIDGETSILDVGAGPFTTIGNLHPQVSITACDLYADQYARILQDAGITPLVTTEMQNMEHMTYSDNSFDIVYCENALDHVEDAIAAINEMMRVTSRWVYMRHFPGVGERNRYKGLHRWNLDSNGVLWNKDRRLSMDQFGFETTRDGRMVVSRYDKCRI